MYIYCVHCVDLYMYTFCYMYIGTCFWFSLATVAKYSSGQIHYYPDFHHTKEIPTKRVERDLK